MSNIIEIKVEELNALPATKIVENENVQTKFIQMYNAIWGSQMGNRFTTRKYLISRRFFVRILRWLNVVRCHCLVASSIWL